MNLGFLWSTRGKNAKKTSSDSFAVRREEYGVASFTVRGAHGSVTQAMLEIVGQLTNRLGLVLVEVLVPARESAYPSLPRTAVQESLLALRDLLGRGLFDAAVFSSRDGIELYLDRLGTLEIRCGIHDEPRFRSLLEEKGFVAVPRLPAIPATPSEPGTWTPNARQRFDTWQQTLISQAPPYMGTEAGS